MHNRERIEIDFNPVTLIVRNCTICGKEYSYKGGTNFFWRGTGDPIGKGDVISSKPVAERVAIWPNDCCEEHRTLEHAKQYINEKRGGK